MVQWLGLYGSTAGGMGSIPGQELRICEPYHEAKKKRKKEKKKENVQTEAQWK